MELYGLRGFTHGWGRLLSVISPEGARSVLDHIETGDDLRTVADAGLPVQYHEIRGGALDALVDRYGIVELGFRDWTAKKRDIGEEALL